MDGCLDVNGFLEFYRDSVKDKKEDTVWGNLYQHGYRNDLKKLNEVESVAVDITTLPRYILSKNPKSFALFFKILDLGEFAAEQTWNLITRLSTNEEIYQNILGMKAETLPNNNLDWSKLIETKSVYRLLYCLQIIESLLENEEKRSEDQEKKRIWRNDFVKKGGFQYLLEILTNKEKVKLR